MNEQEYGNKMKIMTKLSQYLVSLHIQLRVKMLSLNKNKINKFALKNLLVILNITF